MTGTQITEPTFVPDMPDSIYHADPCPEPSLSSTMAKLLLQAGGPARLRHRLDAGAETKRAFDYGSAAHAKALGRGAGVALYPAEYLTAGGNITTARAVQDDLKAWEAIQRAAGLTPLTPKDAAQIDAMVEQLLAHQLAAEILTDGHGTPELSLFGVDDATGRWLRGRLDLHLGDLVAVDYKTTRITLSQEAWERESWRYGYHVQAAHYRALGITLGLLDTDAEMWFVVQESAAPYMVGVYRMDPALIDAGSHLVRRAITLWDRCLTTGEWPGLPSTVQTIGAPRWANPTQEEEE